MRTTGVVNTKTALLFKERLSTFFKKAYFAIIPLIAVLVCRFQILLCFYLVHGFILFECDV